MPSNLQDVYCPLKSSEIVKYLFDKKDDSAEILKPFLKVPDAGSDYYLAEEIFWELINNNEKRET